MSVSRYMIPKVRTKNQEPRDKRQEPRDKRQETRTKISITPDGHLNRSA